MVLRNCFVFRQFLFDSLCVCVFAFSHSWSNILLGVIHCILKDRISSYPVPSPSSSHHTVTICVMLILELVLDKLTSYGWSLLYRAGSSTAKNRRKLTRSCLLVKGNNLYNYLSIYLIKDLIIILFKET